MSDFNYLNKEIYNNSSPVYFVNRAGTIKEASPEFDISRTGAYPYCVIHYVTGGSGTVTSNDVQYPVGEGQIFVLNAYQAHNYRTDSHNLLGLNWLEFAGGDCVKLVGTILNNQSPVIGVPGSIRANRHMLKIFSLLIKSPAENAGLISKIVYSMLLDLLLSSRSSVYTNISEYRMAEINKVTEYIENNLHEKLDITLLSGISNYNPTYFAKLFHKATGVTPHQYVLGCRIRRAKELLCNSEMQLELIAEKLGFCNDSHFTRLFKKCEGLTPSEYKKQASLFRNRQL